MPTPQPVPVRPTIDRRPTHASEAGTDGISPVAEFVLGGPSRIDRREAIRRVTMLLGGVALVGGSGLLSGCREDGIPLGEDAARFTPEDIALLDEIAETILPETSTPGAKAAGVGPFMALMVTDSYYPPDQRIFREGMRRLTAASEEMYGVDFMQATAAQRLALLEQLDREQKRYTDARETARRTAQGLVGATEADSAQADAYLPDQRQQNAATTDADPTAAITADSPPHYFRMMKELALLGYFTSEIGYTQAMRYEESPGRFDPCVPYVAGEKAWAPHA